LDWEIKESNTSNTLEAARSSFNLDGLAPNIALKLDDGSSGASIGGTNIGQFIWLNRFTPDENNFPIILDEVWVQFSNTAIKDDDIEIFIFEDTDGDGDPATGEILLGKYDETVQHADNHFWSKYDLNPAVTLQGPGDILVGVVNRYVSVDDYDFPARIDQGSSQQRSWVGIYEAGDVPENPTFPADVWGTIEELSNDISGNWMIRAFGYRSCANLADISWLSASPTSGTVGADGEQMSEISFDSTGLEAGDYNADLCIASNDINSPLLTVPVTLTVVSRPDPPLVTPDSYTMTEDTVLAIPAPGVLENDVSFFNDLTASLDKQTINGSVEFNGDGSFTYTPTANFEGIDWYTYLAFDGLRSSEPVTVTLRVEADNDVPQSVEDEYVLSGVPVYHEPEPGVLFNDFDIDGDDLTAHLKRGPLKGTLNLNSDGSFTYTPTQMINGQDIFTYYSDDGAVNSNVVTVTLTLTNYNRAPVAENDKYSATMEIALSIDGPGVLINDTDLDGDNLTALLEKEPDNGDLLLKPDGSFVYTPTIGFDGEDSFQYRAFDGLAKSNIAVVKINVVRAEPEERIIFLPIVRKSAS
jgi:hypothetical protein